MSSEEVRMIAVADIGGTHARFAVAEIAGEECLSLSNPVKLKTADYPSLQAAWHAFTSTLDGPKPKAASIALAAPIRGETIKLTNNPWTLKPATLPSELDLDDLLLINDFEAQAHAIAGASEDQFLHIAGPKTGPKTGVTSVIGPGTGLGVAIISKTAQGLRILPTEGGHGAFAPLDTVEEELVRHLRQLHGRVSVERVVAGQGLKAIWTVLAKAQNKKPPEGSDTEVWTLALSGKDPMGSAAIERFCMAFGSVAGDLALAHGPGSVVLTGGLGARLADYLPSSGFAERFADKGRYQTLMEGVSVTLINMEEPGLIGAALAFAHS